MDIALHLFDATTDSTDGHVHTHAVPLTESASFLTELISSSPRGICCLASAEHVPDSNHLSDAAQALVSASAAIGILPGSAHSDLSFIWKRLPSAVAGCVVAPESRGAILLDTRQTLPAPSDNSDQPVQELVIRTAMKNPDAVTLLSSEGATDDSPLPDVSARLPELAPAPPGCERNWMALLLRQLKLRNYMASGGDEVEAEAVLAGLLQVNDYLDESHNHSQGIQGKGQDVNGDYWHGIMHRREPDYGNGKYWFRRVGHHPCFDRLPALAGQALDECDSPDASQWKSRLSDPSGWDSAAFIDFCQDAEISSDAELKTAAMRIQWAEMLLLLEHSWRQAAGIQQVSGRV